MRQLPIPFSTPMVEAILENRKTMTRRTAGLDKINENPNQWVYNQEIKPAFSFFNKASGIIQSSKVRYQVGDQLWVRETFFEARKCRQAPLFQFEPDFLYKADKAFIGENKWKPSLFMPKEAARLWLEVTNVRCERLQNISEADAKAEGIKPAKFPYKNWQYECYECDKKGHSGTIGNMLCEDGVYNHATKSFFSLWRSINGVESYRANPWVFVYEFKRIEKP